jgi:ketosteroid isomerase-like protein
MRESRAPDEEPQSCPAPRSPPRCSKPFSIAFNDHDGDAIMSLFAEDCVLDMPRGPAWKLVD